MFNNQVKYKTLFISNVTPYGNNSETYRLENQLVFSWNYSAVHFF